VNWTMSDRRRRYDVPIGVSRDSDPVHVHTVLSAILDGNPEILSDPKPSVALEGFGESAFNFRLYFWVDDIDTGGDAVHHINTDIVRVFAEEKIEIAYPQREIRVRPAPNA